LKNKYEIRGDVTAIFLRSKKHGNKETLIATSDLERAKEMSGTWYPLWNKGTKSFYVSGATSVVNGKRDMVKLHRWILNLTDPKLHVDHVCHDTLDNCRWALNVVTNSENHQNQRSKSRHSGVHWNKGMQKWKAQITVNGICTHLGYYSELNEAIAVRKEAEFTRFDYKRKLM
jgi:hypothetical protein